MPILLILAPLIGVAALAALVAHAHKAPLARALPSPSGAPALQHFELDHDLPEGVVHEVLGALVHVHDPTALESLAGKHAAKFPLVARELRKKASTSGASSVTSGPPDLGNASVILQAAMKALAQEGDPVELEGFAESIRPQYPTAAALLVSRARELRSAQAVTERQLVPAAPLDASLSPPSATQPEGLPAVASGAVGAGSAGRQPVAPPLTPPLVPSPSGTFPAAPSAAAAPALASPTTSPAHGSRS